MPAAPRVLVHRPTLMYGHSACRRSVRIMVFSKCIDAPTPARHDDGRDGGRRHLGVFLFFILQPV